MPRWTKLTLKILSVFLGIIILLFFAIAIYVNGNQKKLLLSITQELNKNLNGSLTIGGMDPTFLKGFPGVSLTLNDVVVRDKKYNQHHHSFLEARKFNISVNTLALLKGTIEIQKIDIEQASIYLYTDSNGYSNTSVFKKKNEKEFKADQKIASPELRKFTLKNVNFVLDNQKGHKLFQFNVDQLNGKIDYLNGGWNAGLKLKTLVRSLAFNTNKGSFIKDKMIEGPLSVHYDQKTEVVVVDPSPLKIGDEDFLIGAKFSTGLDPVTFAININADQILWTPAVGLLTPVIRFKLKKFNLESPIDVKCTIIGNMGSGGDPLIKVNALVRNNTLSMPGGRVQNCNFDGMYTNNNFNGRGFNNANSAVKLFHFTGSYEGIPFNIDTAAINNLDRPIATGLLKSNFNIAKLNMIMGTNVLKFSQGTAKVNLAFKADIIDFQLTKPLVQGTVAIKNAAINYIPRGLNFKNTSIALEFTEKDLFIKNLRLQSGKSIVKMDGSIKNFLNLYYNAPEKIVLNWKINSPQLYLGEFLGFLSGRKASVQKKKNFKTTFSEDLNAAFEKSKVNMHLAVEKVYYLKFLATGAQADLFLSQTGIEIKNVSVNHAGGALKLNGNLFQKGAINRFVINANISNVDIKNFFYSFNDFGLASLTSNNLRGYLFSKTKIAGSLTEHGNIVKNSITGHVIFDLKQGELLNFEPILDVGKFAFPLRDLNKITFSNLNGKFDLNGDKITINPMKISSSLLNMNVAGIYALNSGTNIALDIPLRNPKKDEEIDDVAEKNKKRMKGIVLHLLATDGENGKIKIKWNKEHE